jgi:tetratricopeptide (TPR) repeat protein
MVGTATPNDEAQLAQTIEMFEVITQSQPQDYQSLEILKEAYVKLGREQEALNTSKRIAQAYVLLGQISSAILEYESILQRFPNDPEVTAALEELELRASNLSNQSASSEPPAPAALKPRATKPSPIKPHFTGVRVPSAELDDGREAMWKIYVEGKVISAQVFDECWIKTDLSVPVDKPIEPFIQILADKGFTPIEKSLKMLSDKCRLGFLPMEKYDIDIDLARSFPSEVCRRWCILPFDRMSKSALVATANPFNRHAAAELEECCKQRLLWYLASPTDIIKALKKVYR